MRKLSFVLIMLSVYVISFPTCAREKIADKPSLYMRHTAGWTSGVLSELTVQKDGAFQYKEKDVSFKGKIPQKEIEAILQQIASAGDGPTAKDAGHVQFRWIAKDGKAATKEYSYPQKNPCYKLLAEIKALVSKYGKKTASEKK